MVISMNIQSFRTDFSHKRRHKSCDTISIEKIEESKSFYYLISFPKYYDSSSLTNLISTEIATLINRKNLPPDYHVLVVGIGSDSHTADSVGPKVVHNLHVNAHLKNLGLKTHGVTISALEPGVLGETGIETRRIVESVTEEIHPDLVILVDSLITDSPEELAHTIILTDEGLVPGSGIKGLNGEINDKTLGVPVLTIGIATALEVHFSKQKDDSLAYLLSPSDIDNYVENISQLVTQSLDDVFSRDVKD